MDIDHVHFYVENAQQWRTWFVQKLGFQEIARRLTAHTITIIVGTPTIQFWLSSPLLSASPVAHYLNLHPCGVADVAFRVKNLEAIVARAMQAGGRLLQPIQVQQMNGISRKIARIQGWGSLQHTLVQDINLPGNLSASLSAKSQGNQRLAFPLESESEFPAEFPEIVLNWVGIDHIVLNVEKGDLDQATTWYEAVLGLQRRQSFTIQTEYSALCSQVLTHPEGSVQFPINQPASSSSQIQEFLDYNRGAGIQHLALRTSTILSTITDLRQQGITFLPVPQRYYDQLKRRPGFGLSQAEWNAIADHEVLVDWQLQTPQALLLQAFTQPIFDQPTFFFELIERRCYRTAQQVKVAEGFGEGNFRALFEAIEREQIKRGSLLQRMEDWEEGTGS